MSYMIAMHAADYARWPSSAAVYLPNGRPPQRGEIFVQSDLGRTLQYMADEEKAAATKGRAAGLKAASDAFYRGDIARTIVAYHNANGGLMTAGSRRVSRGIERRSGALFGIDMYSRSLCHGPVVRDAGC